MAQKVMDRVVEARTPAPIADAPVSVGESGELDEANSAKGDNASDERED